MIGSIAISAKRGVLIETDVDARVAVPRQVPQGFKFQHAQQGGVFGIGLGCPFALLQPLDFRLGLEPLGFSVGQGDQALDLRPAVRLDLLGF